MLLIQHYLIFIFVVVFSSSIQAQSAGGNLPPNIQIMPTKMYWSITGDFTDIDAQMIIDNQDHTIYFDPPVFNIIVKKPPTERYTRERLWNEYFPVFQEIKRSHMNGLSKVMASFYFEGVFSRDGELAFGGPEPRDLFFEFAFATFWLDGKTSHGNYSLETFGPKIFGMDGHENRGKLFAWRAVDSPRDTKTLAAQYDGFPRHTFLDSAVNTIDMNEYYDKRRERESKDFWRAFIMGLADGGVIDQVQCSNAALEGRTVPWYCEESDYQKSLRGER